LVQEEEMQKQLIDLQARITRLENLSQHERPDGVCSVRIGAQAFEPTLVKTGAGFGVRYLLFKLEYTEGYDQVLDDLTAKVVQETFYSENGEVVLRGKTVEIWQDQNDDQFWWAKVEVNAFS